MAPRAGFEPATNRLTADCSATELPRNLASDNIFIILNYLFKIEKQL